MKSSRNNDQPHCLYKPFQRYDSVRSSTVYKRSLKQRLFRFLLIFLAIILTVILFAAVVIFVVFPLTFAYFTSIQTYIIFPGHWSTSETRPYNNFLHYGTQGSRNLHVDLHTSDERNITLGVWQILPLTEMSNAVENSKTFNYDAALKYSSKPVLLYFHDGDRSRAESINTYRTLRRFFQIVTMDYVGFADSSDGQLTETALTNDCVALYKWLKAKTNADIFVWGHGLGSAIATSTIVSLHQEDFTPSGLFLEAPFTTMQDALRWHPVIKHLSWLPWFERFFLDPLESSDLAFRTLDHILNVNCPIMIAHSEDDSQIPIILGEELYRISSHMRNSVTTGTIRLHVFESSLGLGHDRLCEDPEMPNYIKQHIETCKKFADRKIR